MKNALPKTDACSHYGKPSFNRPLRANRSSKFETVHRVVNHSAISPRVRGCLAWAGASADGLQTQSRHSMLNAASLAFGGNTCRVIRKRLATSAHRRVRLGGGALLRPFVPRRVPSEQNDRKRETLAR